MTDKQIIKLKPMEDLNEKIIKEKGNTKCIFYSDDICRNGDKTRDCVNCARVKYHSLYSLNWDNQERLQKIIKQKEQECKALREEKAYTDMACEQFENQLKAKEQECENVRSELIEANKQVIYLAKQLDQLKAENDKFKNCLTEIKEIVEVEIECKTYEIENDCFNGTRCKALNEHIDFTEQILQKISEVENEHIK